MTRLPARYAPWLVSAGLAFPGVEGGSPIPEDGDSWQAGLPELKGTGLMSVRILDPVEGTTLMIDPETPSGMATIGLQVEVEPPAEQVVWYVDGEPFEVADYPYTIRWPLIKGEHTFRVGIPLTSATSATVTVIVE